VSCATGKGLTTYNDPQNKQVPTTYYHCASQRDSDNNKIFATNAEMDSLQAGEKKIGNLSVAARKGTADSILLLRCPDYPRDPNLLQKKLMCRGIQQ